jgi:hypothetical protein
MFVSPERLQAEFNALTQRREWPWYASLFLLTASAVILVRVFTGPIEGTSYVLLVPILISSAEVFHSRQSGRWRTLSTYAGAIVGSFVPL